MGFDDTLWLTPDNIGTDEATFIKRALRLRKGQRVLDAPCGADRIAVHLAKAGCIIPEPYAKGPSSCRPAQ